MTDYVGVPRDYSVSSTRTSMGTPQSVSQLQDLYAGRMGPGSTEQRKPYYTTSMLDSLYGKPPGQVWDTQRVLYALGYLPTFVPGTYDKKTRTALEAAMSDANRNGITLEQMLAGRGQALGKAGSAALSGGGGGGGGGGGPTTTTQRSVSLTSREGAMSVLANALAQELGRQPSDAELTRFTKALNAKEKANPTITTTTVSGHNVSSTTKQGNVDTGYEATQFAKSAPLKAERNRFQDSQYFDVLATMLGVK